MKRCQVIQFGARLRRKLDKAIELVNATPNGQKVFAEAVEATENMSVCANADSTLDSIKLGALAQLSEDNIYYWTPASDGLEQRVRAHSALNGDNYLFVLASDLHEAGKIFDMFIEEISRLTHASMKV